MATQQEIVSGIIQYGVKSKKNKKDIYSALLSAGQIDPVTAAKYVDTINEKGLLDQEPDDSQPNIDPKVKYQEALKFAVDNKNSDDINIKTRANRFLNDVQGKKILPNGYKVENEQVRAILENPDTYHDLTPSIKSELIPELGKAGFKFPRKLNGEQEKARINSESALVSISDMQSEVFAGGELNRENLVKESIPFALGAKKLREQKDNIKDVISRMRSGAALTETELNFYQGLLPGVSDTAESARYKLDQLNVLFSGMAGSEVQLKNDEGKIIKYDDMFDPRQRAEVRKAMSSGFKVHYGSDFDQIYGETVVDPADPANANPEAGKIPTEQKTDENQSINQLKTVSPLEIAKGFGKGAISTANDLSVLGQKSIGSLADLIVSKITGKPVKTENVSIPEEITDASNLGQKVGKVAEFGAEMAFPVEKGIGLAGKGLSKAGELITPIEKSVQAVLKETKLEKLNRYAEQATKAVSNNKEITPLEMSGKVAEDALGLMKDKMKEFGSAKTELTKSLGSTKVGNIVNDAVTNFKSLASERLGLQVGKDGFKDVAGRVSVVSDANDRALLKTAFSKLNEIGKTPTFQKVDDTIDFMQDLLFKRSSNTAVPVNSKVEGIIKNVVKGLNDNLKTIGGEGYTKLNADYSKYKTTAEQLNKLLGKEGNRAGALMKRIFSPSDAGTKELFGKVKELTGVDLVNEATLAKFVMESLGDSRQASMLKELIEGGTAGKAGIINKIVNFGVGKLQNPLGKARSIINKAQK